MRTRRQGAKVSKGTSLQTCNGLVRFALTTSWYRQRAFRSCIMIRYAGGGVPGATDRLEPARDKLDADRTQAAPILRGKHGSPAGIAGEPGVIECRITACAIQFRVTLVPHQSESGG